MISVLKTYSPLFLLLIWACNSPQNELKEASLPPQPNVVNNTTTDSLPPTKEDTLISMRDLSPLYAPISEADFLMGKFDPIHHPSFSKISSTHASNSSMYMMTEAYASFQEMYAAAKADGLSLKIISATRPFGHQKRIWEAKWTGKRQVNGKLLPAKVTDAEERALLILQYSSMPGTSRHHWGTDIDINNLNNSYFEKGRGLKEYEWLVQHAATYGFCQPYSPKGEQRPHGYEEEKWHWSYLPIAQPLTQRYAEVHANSGIQGFKGSETASTIDMIKKYVLGIHSVCKEPQEKK